MAIKTRSSKPKIRHLNDMKAVLYDKKWAKTAPNLPVYYMYRSIKEKNGLRYNITVTPAQMLGKEFAKTKGHDHKGGFKEIYIVLKGKAIYLLQKRKKDKILDVYAAKATKGEAVIIPEGYGHITINPSKKNELKTGDWAVKDCENVYDFIEKMKGACYFYTKNGWIKNKNYKKVPKLRIKKPLKKAPKDLSFLK